MNPQLRGATRSKTVWLGLAITLLGYLQANLPLAKQLIAPFLPPEKIDLAMALLTMTTGLAVIVVRFLTDGPLSEK